MENTSQVETSGKDSKYTKGRSKHDIPRTLTWLIEKKNQTKLDYTKAYKDLFQP